MKDACRQLSDQHRHIGDAVAGWLVALNDVKQLAGLAAHRGLMANGELMVGKKSFHQRHDLTPRSRRGPLRKDMANYRRVVTGAITSDVIA